MPEYAQIILGIIFLAAVFIMTRVFIAWKMRRAALSIVKDLETQGAVDPENAVELPYAKKDWLKIGMRDYRPKTLQAMLSGGILGLTEDGRYYLRRKWTGDEPQTS